MNNYNHLNNDQLNDMAIVASPDQTDTNAMATPIVAVPTDITTDHGDSGVATDDRSAERQLIDAVNNDRHCTLTIGEAQDLFRKLMRRPLSERSLQRYCQSGAILSQLISHSQGKEWLLNEASVIRFIERYPITLTEHPSPEMASPQTTLTPREIDKIERSTPDGVATDDTISQTVSPETTRMATVASPTPRHEARHGDSGVAKVGDTDDFADPKMTGERRRLGDVLIENSRLTALLEGKQEVIETMKNHDQHMREELTQSKSLISKLTGDVTRIASQMLNTMQAIGTAGKGNRLSSGSVADDATEQI